MLLCHKERCFHLNYQQILEIFLKIFYCNLQRAYIEQYIWVEIKSTKQK